MRISEIFRLVYLNLSQNKFKVILTSIGIVVGSATIMLVLAIGMGGRAEVAEQFKNLNAGAIDISYGGQGSFDMDSFMSGAMGNPFGGQGSSRGNSGRGNGSTGFPGGSAGGFSGGVPGNVGGFSGGTFPGGGSNGQQKSNPFGGRSSGDEVILTTADCEELELFVAGITDTTISYSSKASLEGGELESATSYTVAGVRSNYAGISNLKMTIGNFLTDEQDESKEKVCVLGMSVAREIFGSAYAAYDGSVYIDGRPYVVTGVLAEMGTVASGISPDTAVFVPYETGIKYVTGPSISPTVTVIAADVNSVDRVMADVETVLADSYEGVTFNISDAGTKMEAASASNETLTWLLVSMSVIVFIVGGIGIMNVLFLSVKERTNEIGILKAVGCSRKDILIEFLMEASCISFIGAVIGVLLALAVTPLVELFSVRVELTVSGALLSLLFGVVTGTLFGLQPAYRASRLIPVVALNQE
ncbi:MAG: ABC transporter permease [Lachnospiraceae bacterium]|nr:ABC transporter permease [Lachnospiraceae bacterium]